MAQKLWNNVRFKGERTRILKGLKGSNPCKILKNIEIEKDNNKQHDRIFHNFGASKSVAPRFRATQDLPNCPFTYISNEKNCI